MQFPPSGFNSPSMGSDKLREIPVMHESPRRPPQQHPGSQWQQQYPQSRTPPRVNTPPRVGTPPRTEGMAGTPPRFYTLPRNHKERASEAVREIPIQHFSSRPMSPGRQQSPQQQVNQERPVPNPDYPGAQSQPDNRYPPQQYSATLPRATGHAQTYPSHSSPQQYPQSYPQQGYPQQSHGYPQGQGYPQRTASPYTQGPPMPQPQGPPVSQAPFPHIGQQQPQPGQQPRPPMPQPQGHQPSPPPASQPQCRPPDVQQEVYNIPIIRETEKRPKVPSEPQGRQYTPDRQQAQPQNQYGNKNSIPDEGNRTRESSYDHTDTGVAGSNTNNNGQKQEPTPSNHAKEQPKKQPRTPLDDIKDILDGCKQYEERVMTFNGTKKDKEYKLLEEMMTRGILKLDGIESGADINIRQARKAAVREIQSYLDQLELKAFSAESSKENTQTMNGGNGNNSSDSQAEAMDTSANESSGKNVKEMVLESEVQC